jgi:hypothetical protein
MTPIKFKRYAACSGLVALVALASLLAVKARAAGIPETNALTYTGYLEDGDGQPLPGDHSVRVSFWESEEATKDLCSGSNADDTNLQSGRFQIPLPQECADAIKASPDIWVEVEVDGAPLGRTKLGTVPYALEAGHATNADEATHAASASAADEATHAAAASEADGALDDRLATIEDASPARSAFSASNTTGPAIPSGTEPTVVFDSEAFDLGKEYDPATGVFTTKTGGYYDIGCNLIFDRRTSTGTYYLEAGIFINNVRKDVAAGTGDGYVQSYRARNVFKLAAGDKVTCRGYQTGAAAFGLIPARAGEAVSSFSAVRIAPL